MIVINYNINNNEYSSIRFIKMNMYIRYNEDYVNNNKL